MPYCTCSLLRGRQTSSSRSRTSRASGNGCRTRHTVKLSLEAFVRGGQRVPPLADVKPFGRHVMKDVDEIGCVPVVMKALLDAGLMHGDCLTVTGQTMAENLAHIAPPDPDGKVLRAMNNPI